MATARRVTEEFETLNCPVCVTKFDNPRILPCLHTICEKCLRDNIESQGQGKAEFMCPICKTPTVASDAGLGVDRWISEFIPDNTISSMMDISESSDSKDDQCDECQREGENTTAEMWCLDCKEKLCGPCVKYHRRNKTSLYHKMVTINEIENQLPAFNFDRTCARHSGKPLELVCVDHRELCCVVCFAGNHRECSNVRGIDDVAKEQTKGFLYKKVLEDLTKMKTEMKKVITVKNDNVKQLAQEREEIIHTADAVVERIIAKLNQLRKSFRNETGHLYQDGKLSLLKYHKVIQGFMANIVNVHRILENVMELGSPRQKFIMLETVRSQIIKHHQKLKNDLKDDVKVHFTLKPNKILQDMEESLDSLGEMEVTVKTNTAVIESFNNNDENIKKLNSRIQLSTPMCAAQVKKIDTMTSSVTLVKTVTRQNLGKGTYITGGAFLKDGRLIMTDFDNSRLLQLNDDYNIVRKHKMDDCQPGDAAGGNNQNEIYVLVYKSDKSYICRCTLDTRLTITQRIKAPRYTCGIDVIDDTIIVAAPSALLLLSKDGSRVKSIPTLCDYHYVAVSHTPPLLYHGDEDSVVCRTIDGKQFFRLNNDKLKFVAGICVHNDNVYVCGRDSHNVQQISKDGQRSRILLDKLHSISQPWAVLFNQQKNELIVTSNNEDTVIEVYRLN